MNICQDIQSHKMRHLPDYVYWTCLFKLIKDKPHKNKIVI
jgi:hypothetical protein